MIQSSRQVSLDEIDKTILRLLQADGRVSNAEIARRVGLSAPATHARVRRLEEGGVVRQYSTLLDREAMGFDMVCFISVSLQLHQFEAIERFKELVQDMPEVLECHHITGEFDYLLKAVFRNRQQTHPDTRDGTSQHQLGVDRDQGNTAAAHRVILGPQLGQEEIR